MKLHEAMKHLTPGELDAVKQSYRQGFDWRLTLRHACTAPTTADLDEIADAFEAPR